MRKNLLFVCGIALMAFISQILSGCASCSGERADDVSSLPGIYTGEATLILPEQLKSMVKADERGKELVPDAPVPCKLKVKEDMEGGVTIEIDELELPIQGVNVAPTSCKVMKNGEAFTLSGEGGVKFGEHSINYSHKGSIEKGKMDLTITIPIIPMLMEPQIVFQGEKEEIDHTEL